MIINSKNPKLIIKKIRSSLIKYGFSIRQAWHPCHMQIPYKKFESYKNFKRAENIITANLLAM